MTAEQKEQGNAQWKGCDFCQVIICFGGKDQKKCLSLHRNLDPPAWATDTQKTVRLKSCDYVDKFGAKDLKKTEFVVWRDGEATRCS